MKWGWLVVAATVFMALLAISCGGSKSAEPDKVVAVLLKCTMAAETRIDSNLVPDGQGGFISQDHTYVVPAEEHSGEICQRLLDRVKKNGADMRIAVSRLNIRYVVTVRTSTGGGYSLEVPATTPVAVGQVWPPTP